VQFLAHPVGLYAASHSSEAHCDQSCPSSTDVNKTSSVKAKAAAFKAEAKISKGKAKA